MFDLDIPTEKAECANCMSHLLENVGPDHIIVKYGKALAEVERLRSAPKSGLYGKYIIQKADGSPVDPNADYFILRLDTDPIARRAATEYSYFVAAQRGDYQLSKDLQARIAKYDSGMDDAIYLRYVGVQKNEVVEQLEVARAEVERLRSSEVAMQDLVDCMLRLVHSEVRSYDTLSRLAQKAIETTMNAWKEQREEITAKDARIKELSEQIEHDREVLDSWKADRDNWIVRCARLEAAFLEAKRDLLYFRDAPNREAELIELYDEAEQKARAALEELRKNAI